MVITDTLIFVCLDLFLQNSYQMFFHLRAYLPTVSFCGLFLLGLVYFGLALVFPCKSLWSWIRSFIEYQFSSVAESCPTLCDPMKHSTPGLPVHHQLPEFSICFANIFCSVAYLSCVYYVFCQTEDLNFKGAEFTHLFLHGCFTLCLLKEILILLCLDVNAEVLL